jgi:hypothetical protein
MPQPMDPMSALVGMGLIEPPPEKRFDCKIKRCIKSGRLLIDILPPEDLLMDNQATRIDEDRLRFIGDKSRPTRAALKLRLPKKHDIIDELSAYSVGVDKGQEKQTRESDLWGLRNTVTDPDSEQVEIYELYIKVDYDGDGIQEWRQVVVGGIMGERHILSNEEWGGLVPYTDVVPNPQPHRWRGRSLFEDCYDIQRIKTVLLRQTMDNLYLVNNQRQAVDENRVNNKEAVINQELGGTVWTKGDPNGVIVPLVTPFVAKDTFPVLEYWDMVLSKRTGVSRETMGLDMDALQNQTATAVQAQQSAAHTKIETFARNIAECGGLKRLFKCILRLYCENQRKTQTLRLRDKWVQIDPRAWDAEMDVEINCGLGAGTKDRDMAMLQGVLMLQKEIVMGLGNPFNPILNVSHVLDSGRKLAETAGLKNPQKYFPELTQEDVAQIKKKMDQNPPPNPEQMKAQAQMQIEQAKLQANAQMEQVKAQTALQMEQAKQAAAEKQSVMDFQREQQNDQRKAEIETVQAQSDIATNREKIAADIALAEKKFALERELRIIEHQLDMDLKRQDAAIRMTTALQGSGDDGEEDEGKPNRVNEVSAVLKDLLQPASASRENSEAMLGQLSQAMSAMADALSRLNAPKRAIMNYAALIAKWPQFAGTTAQKLALANAATTPAPARPMVVESYRIYNLIVPAEFTALTAANQTLVRDIINMGIVDASPGTSVRARMLAAFPNGTATFAALAALAATYDTPPAVNWCKANGYPTKEDGSGNLNLSDLANAGLS